MEKELYRTILPLTDGSAFKFTIAKYYTPNGTDIHEKGIKPDVKVKMSDAAVEESTDR
ncbi:MAG: S41 family peptidase [Anaerobutyricum hallii]